MSDTNSEEMASFEVIQNHHSSGSFESNEYSFLPEVSSSDLPNGISNHVNQDFDLTNMQSALNKTPDKVVEEVHSHLMGLLEENQSLKESLNKNNSMMKDQMSTISAWREQMIQSKNQQQLNLQKAKEKILELEKNNDVLQEKLSILEKAHENKDTTDVSVQSQIVEEVLKDLGEENNIDDKTDKVVEAKEVIPDEIPDCMFAIQYLGEFVNKSRLSTSKKKYCENILAFLEEKITSFEQSSTVVHTDEESGYEVVHQRKNSKAHDEVESFKKVIDDQNHELEILRKQEQDLTEQIKASEIKIQDYEMALKSKYDEMNTKVNFETSLAEKYKERCESLQQQVDEFHTKLERSKMSDNYAAFELREDIRNLQDILKLEQQANQQDKEKLREVILKCENLQVDHDRVTTLLEIQSKDLKEKDEGIAGLIKTESEMAIEIDHLTAKLCDLEQIIELKSEEIEKIQDEHSKCKEDLELIPILKSQIEVNKLDLESAISARNAAQDTIESLTNELRRFKGDESIKSSPSPSKRRHGHGHHGRNSTSSQAETSYFYCPVCEMGFTSEQAVQNHVEQCLDRERN